MAKFRKIGILSSGGDAPGMNAAIRAVARQAMYRGIQVVGIREGYEGLIQGNSKFVGDQNVNPYVFDMTTHDVSQIITRGGTVLYSSRSPRFQTPDGMALALETCKEHNIDAIVALGGDGTFRGATELTMHGIPSIGIPCTIDNDITATEYTIGFDTAMNTVLGMVDSLRETCESHNRCNVIEVMGRDCGQIALYTGISTGALAIAIPEVPFDEEFALAKLMSARKAGKRGLIAVASEGMAPVNGQKYSEYFTEQIINKTKIDTKFARCGHIVRGGQPTLRDRLIATEMGYGAVNELLDGRSNEVMCLVNGKILPVEIHYALILDRMYKGKLQEGDLNPFTSGQISQMKDICFARKQHIEMLYQMANSISF